MKCYIKSGWIICTLDTSEVLVPERLLYLKSFLGTNYPERLLYLKSFLGTNYGLANDFYTYFYTKNINYAAVCFNFKQTLKVCTKVKRNYQRIRKVNQRIRKVNSSPVSCIFYPRKVNIIRNFGKISQIVPVPNKRKDKLEFLYKI